MPVGLKKSQKGEGIKGINNRLYFYRAVFYNHRGRVKVGTLERMIYRRTRSKLVVDSEEQRRMEQQRQEEQRKRRRKQQQRQRKIKREMKAQQRERVKDEITKMIGQPQLSLLEEDSDSGDSFTEVNQKIALLYPNFQPIQRTQPQHLKRQKEVSEHESSESSESCKEQPQTESISKPTQRMIARKRKTLQMEVDQSKQSLVKQLAVRWWYAMSKWPPSNLDYRKLLRSKGYRLIEQARYRFQENVVQGLTKACAIPDFEGFFKTPNRIIDLRPKQSCPSLLNFRKKTTKQLQHLLSSALSNQHKQLSRVPHKTKDELVLTCELEEKIGQPQL